MSTNSSGTRSSSAALFIAKNSSARRPQAALVLATREHPLLGQAEVPQRRALRGEDRGQRRSRCPTTSGEQRQQQRVHDQAGGAHHAEAAETAAGQLAELEAAELAQVAERLARRGLRLARVALAEPERAPRTPRRPGVLTRISSRILKPRGRSESRSTTSRRTMKQPLIGSVTCHRRVGKSSIAARVETRESADAHAAEVPCPRRRRSGSPRPGRRPSRAPPRTCSSSTSGGCCRSASITHTNDARAARMPATTAPPSPPTRSSRAAVDQVDGARGLDRADRVRRVVVAVVDEDDLEREVRAAPGRAARPAAPRSRPLPAWGPRPRSPACGRRAVRS